MIYYDIKPTGETAMARPGITREQVFEAAEALLLEGQAPTVVGVRTRLGGGSPNTVAPWLAEWKAQSETKKVDALPPLPEPVESAMRQVWGAAWKGAQVQLEAEREALGNVRKDIERERAEMLAEIQRLDSALDEAQGETRQTAETLEGERRAHEQTRGQVREAATLADERQRRIQEQGQEVQEARRQVADLAAKVARLEADLGHAREGLAAAAADAKREGEARAGLARELDQARRETDGLKRDLADGAAALQKLVAEAAALREAQATLTKERDRAQADNERLSREVEGSRETARQAKAGLDAGAKKIAKLEESLEQERQARTEAEKALADARVELATLAAQATQGQELKELLQELRGQGEAKPARRKSAKGEPDSNGGEG
jgi:chromosome segregation ATPase